jgi:predicted acyl esterase
VDRRAALSDGDVATCGWSADCISQLILGIERPPHLKAMFLGHGPSNYYQEFAGTNGAMRLVHGITYSFRNALLDRNVKADPMLEAQILRHYDNIERWYRVATEKFVKVFEDVPPIERGSPAGWTTAPTPTSGSSPDSTPRSTWRTTRTSRCSSGAPGTTSSSAAPSATSSG